MSPEQKTVVFVLLGLMLLGSAFGYLRDNIFIWHKAADLTKAPTTPQIVVHISGAVVSPGVYRLPKGSRVQDAIVAAQGLLKDAESESINMAALLLDGQRVSVLARTPEDMAGGSKPAGPADNRVNINTATVYEIETLPGIGPQTAKRIIEYRQQNGKFMSVSDLRKVPGIGEKTLERLTPLVRLR